MKAGETLGVKPTSAVGAAPMPAAPVPAAPVPVAPPAPPVPPSSAGLREEDAELQMALALSMGGELPSGSAPVPERNAAGGGERLVRRVIPSDNSCLFAALAHGFEGSDGRRKRADVLRRVVADTILANTAEYSEAVLGKAPTEYASWILNSESWGGGIELAILCGHFGSEIAAFDIQTQRVDLFGQGHDYATRAYLLYDGVHYDLVVKQLFDGSPEELDVSVFDVNDDAAMAEAHALVAEAHAARKFTDTAKFSLRCLVCQCGLVGEEGAMEHAKKTGHTNFSEYK
jgi:ubiquitin thioesterase OTU1